MLNVGYFFRNSFFNHKSVDHVAFFRAALQMLVVLLFLPIAMATLLALTLFCAWRTILAGLFGINVQYARTPPQVVQQQAIAMQQPAAAPIDPRIESKSAPELATVAPAPGPASSHIRINFIAMSIQGQQRTLSEAVSTNETVAQVKQRLFACELSRNQRVTFIVGGRRLDDDQTVGACAVPDNATVHALLQDNPNAAAQQQQQQQQAGRPAGQAGEQKPYLLLFCLIAALLGVLWALFFANGTRLFNDASFSLLSVMSVGFAVSLFVFF